MKAIRLLLILAVLVSVVASFGLAQKHPRELAEPAPLAFKPVKPVEFTLANGITVFFLEDRELPLVTINGFLRGGSLYEPQEKAGLAGLVGTVLRSGGPALMHGDAMDAELEFLAATVETGGGTEFMTVSTNCLKKDLTRVTEILASVLRSPAFAQEKIDLAKNQMKEGIRRRWDQPAQGAGMLFAEQVYGETAYGRRVTYKTLNAITRDNLIAFHKKHYVPGNLFLAVSGDLSKEEANALLTKAFDGWKGEKIDLPDVPSLTEKSDGTVYYAYKETPQANVVLGHLGVRRNNPDEITLEVMNDIFGGGGFTARLMKEIRSNRGLTYGIYGGVFEGKDRGVFRIASQLKADKSVEAVALVKEMIKDLQTNPVTEEELALSKKSLANSFVFRFDAKERIPGMYLQMKLEGYPVDYYDTYLERLKKVTREDILAAAKKYMDLEKMIVVVVGDEKKFDKPLTTLGAVKAIDYQKVAEADRAE